MAAAAVVVAAVVGGWMWGDDDAPAAATPVAPGAVVSPAPARDGAPSEVTVDAAAVENGSVAPTSADVAAGDEGATADAQAPVASSPDDAPVPGVGDDGGEPATNGARTAGTWSPPGDVPENAQTEVGPDGVAVIGPPTLKGAAATSTTEATPTTVSPTTVSPTTDPEPTGPETTEPGTTEPGTTEPGTTEPGTTTTDPPTATTEPAVDEPGTTEPETTVTATSDPGTTEATADPAPEPTDDGSMPGDPSGCAVSELLVPSCGAWFGASTPSSDGRYDYEVGLREYEDVAQNVPDILHFYETGAANFPSDAEIAMSERDGRQQSLLSYNWKPSTTLSWRQIADGEADANIEAVARGLRQYPGTLFLTIYHEPENDQGDAGSGRTPADYVDMYRHVVLRLRELDVTNVVYVMNYMGFSRWGPVADDFYPGDDVVDWIAYDPYAFAGQPTFAALLNQAQGDWPGFYEWAIGHAPGKPIMLGEWGFDLATQPNAPEALDGAVDALTDEFPMVKALVYWNDRTSDWDFRLDQPTDLGAAYGAAFARLANQPYFNTTAVDGASPAAPLGRRIAITTDASGSEALDPPPEIPEFPLPVVAVVSGLGLVGVISLRRRRR